MGVPNTLNLAMYTKKRTSVTKFFIKLPKKVADFT